jgi:hypothetical protein
MTKRKIVRRFWIPDVGFCFAVHTKETNASVFPAISSEPLWAMSKWIQGCGYEVDRVA